jgi:hypothetical protein
MNRLKDCLSKPNGASRESSLASHRTSISHVGQRIAELGCAAVGEDPKAFVDRGGLRRLETEAADASIRRVREAAYPLIFKLFGSEMPRGKERKLVLIRLGEDMARIEKALGYGPRATRGDLHEQTHQRMRRDGKRIAAGKRRKR